MSLLLFRGHVFPDLPLVSGLLMSLGHHHVFDGRRTFRVRVGIRVRIPKNMVTIKQVRRGLSWERKLGLN